ncbi:hypothetical protein PLICRDRAFT_43402 [Plicaturopsis crispa FD-325 SS-3]|nr:hypothetical protein PLICRDRAFT_43402 [Plicaturopsis crispa FD-325 SS-3]
MNNNPPDAHRNRNFGQRSRSVNSAGVPLPIEGVEVDLHDAELLAQFAAATDPSQLATAYPTVSAHPHEAFPRDLRFTPNEYRYDPPPFPGFMQGPPPGQPLYHLPPPHPHPNPSISPTPPTWPPTPYEYYISQNQTQSPEFIPQYAPPIPYPMSDSQHPRPQRARYPPITTGGPSMARGTSFSPESSSPGPSAVTSASASPADIPEIEPSETAEEKRRRNTAASARFRTKKKHRTLALEQSITDLTGRAEELEREVAELRRENDWLKEIVVLRGRTFGSERGAEALGEGSGGARTRDDVQEDPYESEESGSATTRSNSRKDGRKGKDKQT